MPTILVIKKRNLFIFMTMVNYGTYLVMKKELYIYCTKSFSLLNG
ncbi:hypothetical protein [Metabacillus litoralis]|nr:hypothetical protein [Metabacillus litoralis]